MTEGKTDSNICILEFDIDCKLAITHTLEELSCLSAVNDILGQYLYIGALALLLACVVDKTPKGPYNYQRTIYDLQIVE